MIRQSKDAPFVLYALPPLPPEEAAAERRFDRPSRRLHNPIVTDGPPCYDHVSMNIPLIVFLVLEVLSITCLVHLWGQPDRPLRKLLWTLPVLLPAMGPLLYGGMYQLPPHDPTSRGEPSQDYGYMHYKDSNSQGDSGS